MTDMAETRVELSSHRMKVERPQLMRALRSKDWAVDLAVWHTGEWDQIPETLLPILLGLRNFAHDQALRRLEVRCERT